MTTHDKNIGKNFGVTDEDLVEAFGLDRSLIGKQGINDAAKMAVRNQIKTKLMADGLPEKIAEKEAMIIQKQNMS